MGMIKKENGVETIYPPNEVQAQNKAIGINPIVEVSKQSNFDPEYTRSIRIMVQGAVQHASIRPISNSITIDDYLIETEKVARELIAIQQKLLKEMLG